MIVLQPHANARTYTIQVYNLYILQVYKYTTPVMFHSPTVNSKHITTIASLSTAYRGEFMYYNIDLNVLKVTSV